MQNPPAQWPTVLVERYSCRLITTGRESGRSDSPNQSKKFKSPALASASINLSITSYAICTQKSSRAVRGFCTAENN